MIPAMQSLVALRPETGWNENTELFLVCRFVDEKGLSDELDAYLWKTLGEEEEEVDE